MYSGIVHDSSSTGFAAGKNAQNDKTDYLDEMTGELDFSKLDHFMGQDAGMVGSHSQNLWKNCCIRKIRERYISSLAPGWSANYVSRSAKPQNTGGGGAACRLFFRA